MTESIHRVLEYFRRGWFITQIQRYEGCDCWRVEGTNEYDSRAWNFIPIPDGWVKPK